MSSRDDNPSLHRIEVERDADGELVSVRFVCDGDDDAPCHHWPDCGCETWGEEHGDRAKGIPPQPGHEDVQQRECWQDPWFNATTSSPEEFADLYDGDGEGRLVSHPDGGLYDDRSWLISGPVSTTFEGDYMTWEYA